MATASPNKCNPKPGPDKTSKESPLRELADSFHDFSKDRGCENYRGVGTDLIELIGNSYIFKVDEITKEHLPDPVKLKEIYEKLYNEGKLADIENKVVAYYHEKYPELNDDKECYEFTDVANILAETSETSDYGIGIINDYGLSSKTTSEYFDDVDFKWEPRSGTKQSDLGKAHYYNLHPICCDWDMAPKTTSKAFNIDIIPKGNIATDLCVYGTNVSFKFDSFESYNKKNDFIGAIDLKYLNINNIQFNICLQSTEQCNTRLIPHSFLKDKKILNLSVPNMCLNAITINRKQDIDIHNFFDPNKKLPFRIEKVILKDVYDTFKKIFSNDAQNQHKVFYNAKRSMDAGQVELIYELNRSIASVVTDDKYQFIVNCIRNENGNVIFNSDYIKEIVSVEGLIKILKNPNHLDNKKTTDYVTKGFIDGNNMLEKVIPHPLKKFVLFTGDRLCYLKAKLMNVPSVLVTRAGYKVFAGKTRTPDEIIQEFTNKILKNKTNYLNPTEPNIKKLPNITKLMTYQNIIDTIFGNDDFKLNPEPCVDIYLESSKIYIKDTIETAISNIKNCFLGMLISLDKLINKINNILHNKLDIYDLIIRDSDILKSFLFQNEEETNEEKKEKEDRKLEIQKLFFEHFNKLCEVNDFYETMGDILTSEFPKTLSEFKTLPSSSIKYNFDSRKTKKISIHNNLIDHNIRHLCKKFLKVDMQMYLQDFAYDFFTTTLSKADIPSSDMMFYKKNETIKIIDIWGYIEQFLKTLRTSRGTPDIVNSCNIYSQIISNIMSGHCNDLEATKIHIDNLFESVSSLSQAEGGKDPGSHGRRPPATPNIPIPPSRIETSPGDDMQIGSPQYKHKHQKRKTLSPFLENKRDKMPIQILKIPEYIYNNTYAIDIIDQLESLLSSIYWINDELMDKDKPMYKPMYKHVLLELNKYIYFIHFTLWSNIDVPKNLNEYIYYNHYFPIIQASTLMINIIKDIYNQLIKLINDDAVVAAKVLAAKLVLLKASATTAEELEEAKAVSTDLYADFIVNNIAKYEGYDKEDKDNKTDYLKNIIDNNDALKAIIGAVLNKIKTTTGGNINNNKLSLQNYYQNYYKIYHDLYYPFISSK